MTKHLHFIVVLTFFGLRIHAQTILGVDVSHYQGTINWTQVQSPGNKVFAFAKATEGIDIIDADFVANETGGTNAGVIMGAYHFAHPEDNSAVSEANYFLSEASPYIKAGYLPPVLDLEDPPTGPALSADFTSAQLTTWVQTWMTTVQNATGIKPILYTDGNYANYLESSLNTYGLWTADPDGSTGAPNPLATYLGVWNTYLFKQYSWTGTVSGISGTGDEDLDVFNGTLAQFNTLIGSNAVTPAFTANIKTVCQGGAVSFTDQSTSTGTITGYRWTFTGGSPDTSTAKDPTITYNTSGTYTVKEVVTSTTGVDSVTMTAYINVIPTSSLPLVETFQSASFPPTGWTMNYPQAGDSAWELCTSNGYSSTQCMYFPANCGYTTSIAGERQQIYTPDYSFVGTSNPKMWFDVAYEPYNRTYSDTLAVYYSLDCGNTWDLIYLKGGMTLSTTGSTDSAGVDTSGGRGCFIPPTTQAWRTDSINLTALTGDASVMFSFESRSGWGNIIYIDNINVASTGIACAPPTATITAGGPTTFCQGGSVTLTASAGGATYLWSNNATTQSISATQSGGYTVVVGNASNCSATSTATIVTVNPLPSPTITPGGATTFCQGGSVTLTASAGSSYLWSTNATTQSINVTQSGNYTVMVTNANNCSATSTATTVTVNSLPTATITAGGATTFCQGASVTLTASLGTAYKWSTNATTQSINVTQSGNYTVMVSNANNCSATSTATSVTINPAPTISASPSSQQVCVNQSVTLTATGNGSSYRWSGTGLQTTTGSSVDAVVSTAGSQIYTVTATLNSCTATASTAVSFNTSVAPTISISQTTANPVCTGSQVSFNATSTSGGASPVYQWISSTNQTGTGTNFTLNNAANGTTLRCLLISNASCASPDSVYSNTLTVTTQLPQPVTLSIATPDTNVCSGENIAFTSAATNAGNSPTYNWYVNSASQGNGSTFTINNIQNNSSVYCIMSSSSSCVTGSPVTSNTVNIQIQTSALASVTISASADTICAGTVVTFTATPGNGGNSPTYTWQLDGNTVGYNSPTYINTNLQNGDMVTCSMTSSVSCVRIPNVVSNSVTMQVNPLPVANAGSAVQITSSSSAILGGNPACSGGTPPYNYLWSPASWLSSYTSANPIVSGITSNTIYTLNVIDSKGCTASDTVGVYLINCTLATPTVQVNACDLAAQYIPAVAYQWYLQGNPIGGANTRFYEASQSGYYYVQVSDTIGCTAQSADVYVGYPACLTTGIETISDGPEFELYPNPANSEITVSFNNTVSENTHIEIFDAFGQVVYLSGNFTAAEGLKYTVNTGSLATGAYLLRVENAEGKFAVKRFVKM